MKKINKKKAALAVCIAIPAVTAAAFLPKALKTAKRKKRLSV